MNKLETFLYFSLIAFSSFNSGEPTFAMDLPTRDPLQSTSPPQPAIETSTKNPIDEWKLCTQAFKDRAAPNSHNDKEKLDFLFELIKTEIDLSPTNPSDNLNLFSNIIDTLFNYSKIEKLLFEEKEFWVATYALNFRSPWLLDQANSIEKKINQTEIPRERNTLGLRRKQIFFLSVAQEFGSDLIREIASSKLKTLRNFNSTEKTSFINATQSLTSLDLTDQERDDVYDSIVETALKVGDRIGLLLYSELRKNPNSTQLASLLIVTTQAYMHFESTRKLVAETLEQHGITILKKADATLSQKTTSLKSLLILITKEIIEGKPVNDKWVTLLHEMFQLKGEETSRELTTAIENVEAGLFNSMETFCFRFELAESCRILGLMSLKYSENKNANTCLKKAIELGSTSALELYIDEVAQNTPSLERQFADHIIKNSPTGCLLTHGLKLTEADLNRHRNKLRALDAIEELGKITSLLEHRWRSIKSSKTLILLKTGAKLSHQIQTEGLNTQAQAQNYSEALKKIRAQFTKNQLDLYLALIQTKQNIEGLRKYEDPETWTRLTSLAGTYASQLVIDELEPQNESVQSIMNQMKELYAEHQRSIQKVAPVRPYINELYRDALIDLARLSIGLNGELPPDVPYIHDELIRGTPSPSKSDISSEKTPTPEPKLGHHSQGARTSARSWISSTENPLSARSGRSSSHSSLEIPDLAGFIRPAHQAFMVSPSFLAQLNHLMTKPTREDVIFLKKIGSTLSKLKLWIENPSLQCTGLNLHKLECLTKHSNIWQAYLENGISGARRLYFKRTDDNRILLLQARIHPKAYELDDEYFSRLLADSPVELTEELWKELEKYI